ncbi:MAG: hypothetical protein U9O87_08780 [Verrucomicrobiota bacterium]|nr:hypothetical protein [Verrucomicrobiota bacterium]
MEYLEKLENRLKRIFKDQEFDLLIYQAGADPYKDDPLGKLSISIEGLKQRDELVLNISRKYKIPVAITLGGGYSKNIVDIHSNTVCSAQRIIS